MGAKACIFLLKMTKCYQNLHVYDKNYLKRKVREYDGAKKKNNKK